MNASNTLLIKSPATWSTTPHASKTFNAVFCLCVALSCYATYLQPLHTLSNSLIVSTIVLASAILLRKENKRLLRITHLENERWFIELNHECIEGALGSGCYQSPMLIVLAVKQNSGKTTHIAVWHDSVSKTDFSFLQIHLSMLSRHSLN